MSAWEEVGDEDLSINKTLRSEQYMRKIDQQLERAVADSDLEGSHENSYFFPFSRQSIYSSMMPVSFNYTLMNSASLLSTVVSSTVNFKVPLEHETKLSKLRDCLVVEP